MSTHSEISPWPAVPLESKTRLLNATLHLVRSKGYNATTVDDICRETGVTKGSFFHHFKTKDDLALAAVHYWEEMTGAFFASAPYHEAQDPVDRLLGYLDFRAAILTGEVPDYTCLLGTLVQETHSTHPQLRDACEHAFASHVEMLARDVQAAKDLYVPDAAWSAESVCYFIQSVLQGSFIFAKATLGPGIARESIGHLRRYISQLFRPDHDAEENSAHDQTHFTD